MFELLLGFLHEKYCRSMSMVAVDRLAQCPQFSRLHGGMGTRQKPHGASSQDSAFCSAGAF